MPDRGLPEQWFTTTVLLRDVAVLVICGLVVRQIYRPEDDLVRWDGRLDDPAGGMFDRAADAPPDGLPAWLRPRGLRRAVAVTEQAIAAPTVP